MGIFSRRRWRSARGSSPAWRRRGLGNRLTIETLEARQLLSFSSAGDASTLPQPASLALPPIAAATATTEGARSHDRPARASQVASSTALASGWRSSVFSGGALGTLNFGFSRDTATIDPLGNPVGLNQPRYAESRFAVRSSPWSVAVPGTSTNQILGSGWDHDGTTPLAVVNDKRNATLTFYGGDGFEVRNRVRYVVNGFEDLMLGAVPGFRYFPRSAIVHEGLIVFETQRDRREGGAWIPEGVSFIYTQDDGQTFARVPQVGGGFDVPAIAGGVTDGVSRGQRWSFSNAFPEKSADDRLGVWFPWTDYLHTTGGPKGGQVGLFRARRSAVDAPWVVEPNKLVYERWQPQDSGGHHAHSAGMLLNGMASFWGDEGFRNMMVRHVASDLENYTGDVWTNIEKFQGAWSPASAKVYDLGNQAASTAPAPTFGEILTTGDVQPELVMKIAQPDDPNGKARVTRLDGSVVGTQLGSVFQGRLSLSIRHLRGRGYVVAEKDFTTTKGLRTVHYSADGIHWTSMPAASGGTPFLYGDLLIQMNAGSIMAANRPSQDFVIRPLLVSPGGTNLSNNRWDQAAAPASGFTYRAIVVQDGVFSYADDGTLLSPQPESLPPVMDGMPIWEITTDGTTVDGGRRNLSDIASDPTKQHWLTSWSYSLDGDGIEPRYKFGTSGPGKQVSDVATRWVTNTQWVPSFLSGVPNPQATSSSDSLLWIYDGVHAAPRRWLTVGEGFVQGNAPTYPLQPGATGSDEVAVISDFSAGSDWTVALSFGLPRVSAFSSHFDFSGPDTVRPIATILQNEDNRAEVNYTRANQTLSIDVYSKGFLIQKLIFPNVPLDIQDRVNLVVSSSDEEFAATLQVPRNLYPITQQVQTGNGSIHPTKIVLGNADGSVVTPMQWYAVQVNQSQSLDAEQRAQLVASDQMFRVLDAHGLVGDLDLNGVVDFDDIDAMVLGLGQPDLYLRTMTVSPTVSGDANGDGDFDFDDVATIVDIISKAPGTLPGDMDFDGDVDFDDISGFALGLSNPDAYAEEFGFPARFNGDMDGDRDLDFDDIPGFVQLLTGRGVAAAAADPPDAATGDVAAGAHGATTPTRHAALPAGSDASLPASSESSAPAPDPIRTATPVEATRLVGGRIVLDAGSRGEPAIERTIGGRRAVSMNVPDANAARATPARREVRGRASDRFDRLRSLLPGESRKLRDTTERELEAVWAGPIPWFDRAGTALPGAWLA